METPVIIALISIALFVIIGIKHLILLSRYYKLKDKYNTKVSETKKYRKWWMENADTLNKINNT